MRFSLPHPSIFILSKHCLEMVTCKILHWKDGEEGTLLPASACACPSVHIVLFLQGCGKMSPRICS